MAGWYYIRNGAQVDWPNGQTLPEDADVYHVDFVNQFNYALAERYHAGFRAALVMDAGKVIKTASTDGVMVKSGGDAQSLGWINQIITDTNSLFAPDGASGFILPSGPPNPISLISSGDRLSRAKWTQIRDRINEAHEVRFMNEFIGAYPFFGRDNDLNFTIASATVNATGFRKPLDFANPDTTAYTGDLESDVSAYLQSVETTPAPYVFSDPPSDAAFDDTVYPYHPLYGSYNINSASAVDTDQDGEADTVQIYKADLWYGYLDDINFDMNFVTERAAVTNILRYASSFSFYPPVTLSYTGSYARGSGILVVPRLDAPGSTYPFPPSGTSQYDDFGQLDYLMDFTDFTYR
jgi:hypothetical protein